MDKYHFSGFSSNSRHFTILQPRGFFLVRFFFEKSCSNIWRIYESTPQALIEKDPQNSNSEESLENREIFAASKFDLATGVRPQSRKNEISEISPGQKCVIQIKMSNSRIPCTLNGERRSS